MVRDSLRDRKSDVPTPPTPGFWLMVGRACARRCSVCGSGKLFRHWTQMVERCPSCGYLFERSEGQFVSAVGMNTIITFGLLLVVLVVGFITTSPEVPAVKLSIIGVAIAVLAPIFLYPFSKTTWTAIDLKMTPLEPGEAPLLAARLAAANYSVAGSPAGSVAGSPAGSVAGSPAGSAADTPASR